jgi:hypothetical protein
MRIGRRAVAWGLAATLVAGAAAADDGARTTVTIRLDDRSGTPAGDLAAAKSEMSRIFGAAGIVIAWADGHAIPHAGQPALFLLNTREQPLTDGGDVAGLAIRETSSAFVYCDRLGSVTEHLPVDANVILGRVMAHEIGHLLLPPGSHSRVGIMRPHVDFSQTGLSTFTSQQVRALHFALENRGVDHASAMTMSRP